MKKTLSPMWGKTIAEKRAEALRLLKETDLTVIQIAKRTLLTDSTIYNVANVNDIDMRARSKRLKLISRRSALIQELRDIDLQLERRQYGRVASD